MKPNTMMSMSGLDMTMISTVEAMSRFVAILAFSPMSNLEEAERYLSSLVETSDTATEFTFFSAAVELVREAQINAARATSNND